MTEEQRIEQLAALLDGELDADRAEPGVRGLLMLADGVRDHAELVTPDPVFRAALRRELLAAGAPPASLLERAAGAAGGLRERLRTSARAAVAAGTAAVLVAGAGAAAAAQQAVPGDLLHPLKEATEAVRLALVGEGAEGGRLQLQLASERLDELATGRVRDPDAVIALLEEMDERTITGVELLLGSGDSDARDVVVTFVERQREGLTPLLGSLPLQSRPVAEDSLELLRRIALLLLESPGTTSAGADAGITDDAGSCICPPGTVPAGGGGLLPGGGEPAVDGTCDCVEAPGGADSREPLPLPGTDDGGTGLEQDLTTDGGDQLLDDLEDTVQDTTDTLDDTVGGTTDTLGDTVDDVGDVVGDTTDAVGDVVDGVGDTVDDTVDGTTDTLNETVDDLGDAVEDLGGLLD